MSQKASHANVVILDFGSQYTQLIARRIREHHIHSVVIPGDAPLERIQALHPSALILSGGPNSVYDEGAPTLASGLLQFQRTQKIPVLGICYGMQLLAHLLGGKVESAPSREYGRMDIQPLPQGSHILGQNAQVLVRQQVWMSHGDETKEVPPGFQIVAKSISGSIAAMENAAAGVYALQFHPEVTHTQRGAEILKRFLTEIAGLKGDWTMRSVLDEQIDAIRAKVPADQHVICALSGGVDSAVAATLVHRAIGDRLHCFFVDHGLLRFKERERVVELFQKELHLPVTCVDASDRFLSKLAGVADPERKRKIIGAEFIGVFDEAADQIAKTLGSRPGFLVQGTLYPDVIESSPRPVAGVAGAKSAVKSHSVTIKSHHNVGGLPENMRFELIEPLRDLFKDEVRELGKVLGVPQNFLKRHPFPGPGLAVRIIGEITRERLATLQAVDEVFIQELHRAGLYDKIWQAFAVFLPIKSVGVQGDGRTHDHVVALRAVTSSDGMTADWYHFEPQFLAQVSAKICNEVRGVNRVVYDISSKPPATIEWE